MEKEDDFIGQVFENKHKHKYEVIGLADTVRKVKRYTVKFIESGYETVSYKNNIKLGAISDRSRKDYDAKYEYTIGKTVTNIHGVEAKIVDREPRCVLLTIQFIESGYITKCTIDNFTRGKIKDLLTPSVQGVGMIGYIDKELYPIRELMEYKIWDGMMQRCYAPRYKDNKAYENAEVCDRWKRFDYFFEDIKKVEGYEIWKKYKKENPHTKNVYEFDKDTKGHGSKLYCPENCCFIHKKYNAAFTSWAKEDVKERILNDIEKERTV